MRSRFSPCFPMNYALAAAVRRRSGLKIGKDVFCEGAFLGGRSGTQINLGIVTVPLRPLGAQVMKQMCAHKQNTSSNHMSNNLCAICWVSRCLLASRGSNYCSFSTYRTLVRTFFSPHSPKWSHTPSPPRHLLPASHQHLVFAAYPGSSALLLRPTRRSNVV